MRCSLQISPRAFGNTPRTFRRNSRPIATPQGLCHQRGIPFRRKGVYPFCGKVLGVLEILQGVFREVLGVFQKVLREEAERGIAARTTISATRKTSLHHYMRSKCGRRSSGTSARCSVFGPSWTAPRSSFQRPAGSSTSTASFSSTTGATRYFEPSMNCVIGRA